jgi:hypothetical protein
MNCNQLCSINYGNSHQKRFFEHLELRSHLEDKQKLLYMPFLFGSVFINIIRLIPQHRPGFHLKYTYVYILCQIQNRSSSPLEDYCFSTLLTLQWKVIGRVQPGENRSV